MHAQRRPATAVHAPSTGPRLPRFPPLSSGAVLGLGLAAAVGALFRWGGWMFTTDVAVQAAVRQLAPVAMAAISVCSGALPRPPLVLPGAETWR